METEYNEPHLERESRSMDERLSYLDSGVGATVGIRTLRRGQETLQSRRAVSPGEDWASDRTRPGRRLHPTESPGKRVFAHAHFSYWVLSIGGRFALRATSYLRHCGWRRVAVQCGIAQDLVPGGQVTCVLGNNQCHAQGKNK